MRASFKETRAKIIKKTFGLASNIMETILLVLSAMPYFLSERSLGRAMENVGIILDGYDPKKLRRSFFNLKNRKYLDKKNRITERGWQKIKSLAPSYQKLTHWDGQWRLVVFDIPERLRQKRDILRDKLIALGFGMLQKSIWLSPYNYLEVIEKLVGYYKINNYVLATTTSNIGNQDDKFLAETVWHLNKISQAYKEFIIKYQKAEKPDISGKFFYLFILKQDPQLPVELLPKDWQGGKAAKIAKKKKWI